MITLLDAEVGKIMSALWQSNLQRNTVVFFTGDTGSSDQGSLDSGLGSRTGPLRGGSRQLYEGNLRVPMIVCWPGIIPSNISSDFPWAFWDFMHTVAQIADVTRPDGLDGVSVLPTLLGKDQKPTTISIGSSIIMVCSRQLGWAAGKPCAIHQVKRWSFIIS